MTRASWLWLAQTLATLAVAILTAACVFVALGILARSF